MWIFVFKLFIIIALLLFAVIGEVLSTFSLKEIVGAAALGAIVYVFCLDDKKDKNSKTNSIASKEKTENNESFIKAWEDYSFLQATLPTIQDGELRFLLQNMQQIAERLLRYLTKYPERMSAASRFINYYQDRTASLIRQYISMKEVGLRRELQQSVLEEMKNTFRGFLSAYESQLAKVMESQILDMEAEMKVARQVMDEEGIQAKEAVYVPSAGKDEKKSVKEQSGNAPLKYAGIALAAIIGAVGIYKLTEKKKEE